MKWKEASTTPAANPASIKKVTAKKRGTCMAMSRGHILALLNFFLPMAIRCHSKPCAFFIGSTTT